MDFTIIKLLSYEAVSGTDRAETLVAEVKTDICRLFALEPPNGSLTQEEKNGVMVLAGEQGGVFKVFVHIPCLDKKRVNEALGQIWNPDLLSTKNIDVFLDVKQEE